MFAIKSDLECRCCGVTFGFITHKHQIIIADEKHKLELPGKSSDIVEISQEQLFVLNTITVQEYMKEQIGSNK